MLKLNDDKKNPGEKKFSSVWLIQSVRIVYNVIQKQLKTKCDNVMGMRYWKYEIFHRNETDRKLTQLKHK